MTAPPICSGNGLCDSRIPHICYRGLDTDEPWLVQAPVIPPTSDRSSMTDTTEEQTPTPTTCDICTRLGGTYRGRSAGWVLRRTGTLRPLKEYSVCADHLATVFQWWTDVADFDVAVAVTRLA